MELIEIGNLAIKYNLIILADEAHQWYQTGAPGHTRIGMLND